MPDDDVLLAAAAAAALGAEDRHRALLQAIVETARAIFRAEAASVFLHDAEAGELVFEAVSGRGEQQLVGQRFPDSTGIAGWVLATLQPLAVDDLASDARFDSQAALATGYVPRSLVSAPLLAEDRAVGLLNVLDPATRTGTEILDLAGLFATQAAIALDLLQRARRAQLVLAGADGPASAVARLIRALDRGDEDRAAAGRDLVRALDRLLRPAR